MASQINNYQCPACTGPLQYAGDSGRLECEYCGSSFSVQEIEALYEQKEQAAEEAAAQAAETAEAQMEELSEEDSHSTILYFISREVLMLDLQFFSPIARRCIVLTEGEQESVPEGFRSVDIRRPERELIKSFLTIHNAAHLAHGINPHTSTEQDDLLSQREKDVLSLIVKGYINKEIADKLNISTPTVIFHRRNISEKIGSKSVGRLTIYAVMNGIVDVREL